MCREEIRRDKEREIKREKERQRETERERERERESWFFISRLDLKKRKRPTDRPINHTDSCAVW